ncbi:hypothetical protein BKA70DRAFT_1435306 [Coprinopsis sp. MPI-PUGE-AT-0042]|nr:hypothetical protein BKA70DRAFT_1435306 [Coprinopsis sp. MPI-PUGE-AT-0042]
MEHVLSYGCTTALSLAGDAFLAWRATVIWNHHRGLRCVPGVVYGLYCGVCVASLLSKARALKGESVLNPSSQLKVGTNPDTMLKVDQAIGHVQAVYRVWRTVDFAMSVGVNIVTTAMITARLLLMERNMHRITSRSPTFKAGLPYRQIIALLLESALPFTAIGVVAAVLSGVNDPSDDTGSRKAVHAFPVMMALWTNSLALSPQLIIFRIISGTTWTSNPAPNESRPISQPILFADDPVVSLLTSEYADEEHELEAHTVAQSSSSNQMDLEEAPEQPTSSRDHALDLSQDDDSEAREQFGDADSLFVD